MSLDPQKVATISLAVRRANTRIRELEARVATLESLLRDAREAIADNDGNEHPTVVAIDKAVPPGFGTVAIAEALPVQQRVTEGDEWRQHVNGPCPCAPLDKVDVLLFDGTEMHNREAARFIWDGRGLGVNRITHWRPAA